MLITQYCFTLPASFDMDGIRQRIVDRATVFDQLPDLGWKAFLLSDRARQRDADNTYAPVYLWPDTSGWLSFLKGPLFASVTEAFGHTHPWSGLCTHHLSRLPLADARWCRVRRAPAGRASGLAQVVEAQFAHADTNTWWAMDTSLWQLREFCFLLNRPDELLPGDRLYEVCHVSSPGWPRQ